MMYSNRHRRVGLSSSVLALTAAAMLPSVAMAQLDDADIAALQLEGVVEGWTFVVAPNPATRYTLDELCGLVPPDNWEKLARWDPCEPRRDLPEAFDWRDVVDLPPIRNQGGCGSCWAFATTGALECSIAVQDGLHADLSEQWLVSCNSDGWDCGGGWFAHNYHEWKNDPCGDDGAVLEEFYRYTATNGTCDCPVPHTYWINDWAYIGSSGGVPSVNAMKQAILDHGPISVAVRANSAMQSYSGGIFNGCSSGSVNHAVVLVGWDDTQGGGIWIMRNSWGAGWGEGGYMRMPYGCSAIGYAACYVDYDDQQGMIVSPHVAPEFEGDPGGPFLPDSEAFVVTNVGETGLTYTVSDDADWLTIDSPTGYIEAHENAVVSVSINGVADALPLGDYEATLQFTSSNGIGDTTRTVKLTVGVASVAYLFSLSEDPGWTCEGDWAFGSPTGQGGDHGGPDPTSGYLGSYVYGYNLNGDYPNDMPERHLTSTPIDCTGLTSVHLKFRRWLGVEKPEYDHAYVRVSNDGANWTTVWENAVEITDSTWQQMDLDISSVADNQSTVYLRWTMGSTDGGWRYCGWNIDHIQIFAVGEPPQEPPTIEHQLVEVPISAEAQGDDPTLASAKTFDLQVIITEDDDWTATGATAWVNGSFYQHPTADDDVAQTTFWPMLPSLEYDTFFSARNYAAPGFAEGPFTTDDEIICSWFDTVNTGPGTYTIARFTVKSGSALTVNGISTAKNTGGELHPFGFTVYFDLPNDCPGDLNGDGVRDLADLGILLASFEVDDGGDIDGDGDTDLADLGALLAVFDVPCPG